MKEQASAVDERFGVKRKIRNLADDAVRRYPMVSVTTVSIDMTFMCGEVRDFWVRFLFVAWYF